MTQSGAAVDRRPCEGCKAEIPTAFLSCPGCGHLVYVETLKERARAAEQAEAQGDPTTALTLWRAALDLLPPGSVQYQRIQEKVRILSVVEPPRKGMFSGRGKLLAVLGGVALLFVGKGKLLLLGLLKAKTLLSMLVTMGVYGSGNGWKYAVGLVLSIYVHEMGHVAWLRRYGIAASAPMFIPGIGAFVRLHQYPSSPAEDARIGLAGPVWGAVTAVIVFLVGEAMGWPTWIAIARIGAWINLFNLVPVWQLDGSRGFRALSRRQRALVAVVLWALFLGTHGGLVAIIAIAATVRSFDRDAPATPDGGAGTTYLSLAIGLTLMSEFFVS